MSTLQAIRKLVLGETWRLPLGIAAAVGIAAVIRVSAGAGGWWADWGGAVLLAALAGALVLSLASPRR